MTKDRDKILACFDFSNEIVTVAAVACELAAATDAELHGVVVGQKRGDRVVLALDGRLLPVTMTAAGADIRLRLQRASDELELPELVQAVVHIGLGSPAEAIVRTAAELDAKFIVVGTHGRRGAKRMMLGSVAEAVVRGAGCTVVVARDRAHDAALTALDGPEEPALPVNVII